MEDAVAAATHMGQPDEAHHLLLAGASAIFRTYWAAFCTYSMGSHDTLRTLPKSPRRLRILAKAGSSRKSHIHCAAPRGVRVDQRLAGEITCGTSKNHMFYKGFTMTGGHGENVCFITFLSIEICCLRFAKA